VFGGGTTGVFGAGTTCVFGLGTTGVFGLGRTDGRIFGFTSAGGLGFAIAGGFGLRSGGGLGFPLVPPGEVGGKPGACAPGCASLGACAAAFQQSAVNINKLRIKLRMIFIRDQAS
jgi:hypothetical protein